MQILKMQKNSLLLTTRQPKNVKRMLVTAKFDLHPELPNKKTQWIVLMH